MSVSGTDLADDEIQDMIDMMESVRESFDHPGVFYCPYCDETISGSFNDAVLHHQEEHFPGMSLRKVYDV